MRSPLALPTRQLSDLASQVLGVEVPLQPIEAPGSEAALAAAEEPRRGAPGLLTEGTVVRVVGSFQGVTYASLASRTDHSAFGRDPAPGPCLAVVGTPSTPQGAGRRPAGLCGRPFGPSSDPHPSDRRQKVPSGVLRMTSVIAGSRTRVTLVFWTGLSDHSGSRRSIIRRAEEPAPGLPARRPAPRERAAIEPISQPIVPRKQGAKRHYGSHSYFTKRAWNVVQEYINYFSEPGELVLDPFGGSGITAIEALVLRRRAIHVDLAPWANLMTWGIGVAPVSEAAFQSAFADLSDKSKEPIEQL